MATYMLVLASSPVITEHPDRMFRQEGPVMMNWSWFLRDRESLVQAHLE